MKGIVEAPIWAWASNYLDPINDSRTNALANSSPIIFKLLLATFVVVYRRAGENRDSAMRLQVDHRSIGSVMPRR